MKSTIVIVITIVIMVIGVIVGVTLLFGRGDKSAAGGISGGKAKDGGVYVSQDAAITWQQKAKFGDKGSIAGVDVNDIVFHPKDASRVFLATTGNGLLMSSATGSADWTRSKDEKNILTPDTTVQQIAFDPTEPTYVYLAISQKGIGRVLRSDNGGTSFKEMYQTAKPKTEVYGVTVDHSNTHRIYIGTGEGGLLMSENRGDTWSVIKWFSSPVRRIYIHPKDADFIYLTFLGKDLAKVQRSHDHGATWEELKITPPKGQRISGVYSLAFHPTDANMLFLATSAGVFSTEDAGATWQEFPLIIPPAALPAFAVAVDPQNPFKIYVAAAYHVYKSIDAGATWQVQDVPTIKNVRILVFSPTSSDVLWAGIRK